MNWMLYAEVPGRRAWQVAGDVMLAAWVYAWYWLGRRLHEIVSALATPGRLLEGAGSGFAARFGEVAERIAGVPLVGDTLRTPFDGAADVGLTIADAGLRQQEAVASLALWIALLVAGLPVLFGALLYLPRRLRWIRTATAARELRSSEAGRQTLALRAAATRPLRLVAGASPWSGEDADVAALAALELGALGLREREPPAPEQ